MLMFEQEKIQELTSRQQEILSLLRQGFTNPEICKALNISLNTVKVHLTNIYKILEVTNRTEAVFSDDSPENEDKPKKGRKEVSNCKDVKVIYTRKTDVFVPLHTRADIAKQSINITYSASRTDLKNTPNPVF